MVDLPKKKVGIVACSGEELAEGTVTRLAALKVLEQLRPADTVTICLPLFLAGGEGDRAFARFYPTIAIDGCDKRCAARATEMYSGKPAASVVVTDLVAERGLGKPEGPRRLNAAGHAGRRRYRRTRGWPGGRVARQALGPTCRGIHRKMASSRGRGASRRRLARVVPVSRSRKS